MKTDRIHGWVVQCDCCGGPLKAEEHAVGKLHPINMYIVYEKEEDALRVAKEFGVGKVVKVMILCTHENISAFHR